MSENGPKYDENDPKIKEKLAVLAQLNASTDAKIDSWQGMYDEMKEVAKAYITNPTKNQADFTVVALLSFIIALEQLPEEGDIRVIAHKMNEVLVMRPDLTGAVVYCGKDAEERYASDALEGAVMLATALGVVNAAVEEAEHPAAPTTTKPTRTIH